MSIPVSLREVAGELESLPDEFTGFVNSKTGEVLSMKDEYLVQAEDGYDPEDLLDWEVEIVEIAVQISESDDYVALPSKFDIHEYSIMEKFCWSIEDEDLSHDLTRAIKGSGAFGRFRYAVEQNDLLKKWYEFKREAYEDIAAEWLDANKIPFVRP